MTHAEIRRQARRAGYFKGRASRAKRLAFLERELAALRVAYDARTAHLNHIRLLLKEANRQAWTHER